MENNTKGGFGRRTEGRREYGNSTGKRPRISRAGTRGAERVFGESSERRSFGEGRSFGGDRPRRSFGEGSDRPRRGFGEGSDRPRRSFGEGSERRSFGEGRSFGGDRPRRSFGEGSDRPRRSFGEGGDRPRRSFGEGSERRSFGDRKPFGGDRPRRSFGEGGDRRSGGFRAGAKKSMTRRDFNYFRDEQESGISKMISRRPQLDGEYSDNDMVMAPVKEEVRLNKFIANSGVCSRREADNLILAGCVTVNGEVVTELGTKVNINTDDIRFNGERLKGEDKVYIVMNKPKGYVTTASDPHADRTVMDLLKGCPTRVFPVGRLDKNTTGVLMFTNDGEIAEKLTHPSYDKKKIYQVSLDGKLKQEDYEHILRGVELNDGTVAADELEYIEADDHRKLGIEIHSGKNRIVRRIFESLGYEVKALDRVYFAGLTKKGLKRGEWRYLTEGEINLLKMGAYL